MPNFLGKKVKIIAYIYLKENRKEKLPAANLKVEEFRLDNPDLIQPSW